MWGETLEVAREEGQKPLDPAVRHGGDLSHHAMKCPPLLQMQFVKRYPFSPAVLHPHVWDCRAWQRAELATRTSGKFEVIFFSANRWPLFC